jgi:hypothetical protein
LLLNALNQRTLSKLCCLNELAFAVELCCLQRISVCCWNYVACSESVFAVATMLPTTNQCSLLKLCCLQQISIRCWNCVVCSETLAFTAELCRLQWISFAVEFCMSPVNQFSLTNSICNLWIGFHWQIVCHQRPSFRWRLSMVATT